MIPLDFAAGVAAGLALAVALYLVLWYWARRSRARAVVADPGGPPPWVRVEDPGPEGPAPATVDVSGPEGPAMLLPFPALAGGPSGDGGSALAPPAMAVAVAPRLPAAADRSTGEKVRLSQRVILHVYSLGHLPPGAVAPVGFCQAGIGEAVGVSQAGLAAVLRRLEAAGVLSTERGHVQGRDRRLKIYRLSDRGVEIARELRARSRPGAGRRSRGNSRTD